MNPSPGRELSGKVVLVTGAARNIGRAIARALAAGGAGVMVNALRSRDDLAKWSCVARERNISIVD